METVPLLVPGRPVRYVWMPKVGVMLNSLATSENTHKNTKITLKIRYEQLDPFSLP